MTLPWRPLILCGLLLGACVARGDDLATLDGDFWRWRADHQPFSADDLPRIERRAGAAPAWDRADLAAQRRALAALEARWRQLAPAADAPVPAQVDWRLLGSAIARVHWELDVERGWRRNPAFYVQQALGAVAELLLPPMPWSAEHEAELVRRMQRIPALLAAGEDNLDEARRPFVRLAIDDLDGIGPRLHAAEAALGARLRPETARALSAATTAAVTALEHYRRWLEDLEPGARPDTAVGREAYAWYLANVALVPETPEELRRLAREEWSRAVAFEAFQELRDAGLAPASRFATLDAEIAATARREAEVRAFLGEHHLLSVPAATPHYRTLPLPPWLEPLQAYTSADDLTGPSRTASDAVRYLPPPGPALGFFHRSMAHDPGPVLVHEGIPGHYLQLWLGWQHPDAVRRHYYDSVPNEGIGYYAEEMLLQAGFFDGDPRTRETIYSFMRLRALRVEVDVRLALGEFSLEEAASYLERTVPMDRASALEEAALFASTPGQAIAYQLGKSQLTRLLSDARRAAGPAFSLQAFHDATWREGNVPFSLQRWERLGDPADVPAATPLPASSR